MLVANRQTDRWECGSQYSDDHRHVERPRKAGVWKSVQKRPPTRGETEKGGSVEVSTKATADTWRDRERWECGSQYNGDHGQVERQVGVWQSTVSTKATTDTWRQTVADR